MVKRSKKPAVKGRPEYFVKVYLLVESLVDDPLTPKLSKASRDALAKLRAEIQWRR